MEVLPREWLEIYVTAFQSTGIKFLGNFEDSIRKTLKYSCCPFTLLLTKTVRIEVVNVLKTDAWKKVVTRFRAIKCQKHTMTSKKRDSFCDTAREGEVRNVRMHVIMKRLRYLMAQQKIRQINPPGAPFLKNLTDNGA